MLETYRALLREIVDVCNRGETVMFSDDMGGNTLTICCGNEHNHLGVPDGDLDLLASQLVRALTGGPGISWGPGGVPPKSP